MSIDESSQTAGERTPVPLNTNAGNHADTKANANAKATLRRAPRIAEQIAQGWRALPEERKQRWKAANNAADPSHSQPQAGQLHLIPRPLPTDQKLFIDELLHAEPNHRTNVVDDHAPVVALSDPAMTLHSVIAGRTVPHPWRIPGAFSDGIENVPRLAAVSPEDGVEYNEEAAKRYCMSFEAEKHFQAFEAHLLANRKSDDEVARDAAMQQWLAQKQMGLRAAVLYRAAGRWRTGSRVSLRFPLRWV